MSVEPITISKKKPEHSSMDYAFLRNLGLEQIQKLAGKTWTDHNAHDPGITILEVLCYAITELGYRTNYDIRDILASGTDSLETNFYTAAQILPCNPLTTNDFRRLMIDCSGVRNAWLEKPIKYEQDIYFDNSQKEFNYASGQRARLNGLYDIQLEFEEDDVTAGGNKRKEEDLNSNVISWELSAQYAQENRYQLEVEFPYWDQLPPSWSQKLNIKEIEIKKSIDYEPDERYDYFFRLDIALESNPMIEALDVRIKIDLGEAETIDLQQKKDLLLELKEKVKVVLTNPTEDGLINFFIQKIITTNKKVDLVRRKLNSHRNLCEDFYQFKAVRVQEIGVKASIDISAKADADEVLTKIYQTFNNFFSPSIRFYSLAELMNQGMSPDEIFDGPLLDNGFIRSEDLAVMSRRNVIYTSDLIHIIMKIEGVKSVKNLRISNSIYNQIINEDVINCLKLVAPETYQPKLSTDNCDIEFYLDGKKVSAVEKKLNKKEENNPGSDDLNIPEGEDMHIEKYYSLQNLFPSTYGIGEAGLPDSVSDARKIQAKQLKAYLLFFEQFLANYYAQLKHVTSLFSMDRCRDKTYFSQPLKNVPNVADLLQEDYESMLQGKVENTEEFNARRSQFLEHLIARFSESFTDYSSYAKGQISVGDIIEDKISFLESYPELSKNRGQAIDYLLYEMNGDTKEKEEMTSGFEMRLSLLLGLEIASQGTKNVRHKKQICTYRDFEEKWKFKLIKGYGKKALLLSSRAFESEDEAYSAAKELISGWPDSIAIMPETIQAIETKKSSKGKGHAYGKGEKEKPAKEPQTEEKYKFLILDINNNEIAESVEVFETAEKRNKEIENLENLLSTLSGLFEEEETLPLSGKLRVIEHILLRPKINREEETVNIYDGLLEIPANHLGSKGELAADPYSFKITVLMPWWEGKFVGQNKEETLELNEFGRYSERVVRMETPAHIKADIFWIDKHTMEQFENKYDHWLGLNAGLAATPDGAARLNNAHHDLIEALSDIRGETLVVHE